MARDEPSVRSMPLRHGDLDAFVKDFIGFSPAAVARSMYALMWPWDRRLAYAVAGQAWEDMLSPIRFLFSAFAVAFTLRMTITILLSGRFMVFLGGEYSVESRGAVQMLLALAAASPIMAGVLWIGNQKRALVTGFGDATLKVFQLSLYTFGVAMIAAAPLLIADWIAVVLTGESYGAFFYVLVTACWLVGLYSVLVCLPTTAAQLFRASARRAACGILIVIVLLGACASNLVTNDQGASEVTASQGPLGS